MDATTADCSTCATAGLGAANVENLKTEDLETIRKLSVSASETYGGFKITASF